MAHKAKNHYYLALYRKNLLIADQKFSSHEGTYVSVFRYNQASLFKERKYIVY
jgi:hypothetical protein